MYFTLKILEDCSHQPLVLALWHTASRNYKGPKYLSLSLSTCPNSCSCCGGTNDRYGRFVLCLITIWCGRNRFWCLRFISQQCFHGEFGSASPSDSQQIILSSWTVRERKLAWLTDTSGTQVSGSRILGHSGNSLRACDQWVIMMQWDSAYLIGIQSKRNRYPLCFCGRNTLLSSLHDLASVRLACFELFPMPKNTSGK